MSNNIKEMRTCLAGPPLGHHQSVVAVRRGFLAELADGIISPSVRAANGHIILAHAQRFRHLLLASKQSKHTFSIKCLKNSRPISVLLNIISHSIANESVGFYYYHFFYNWLYL